MKPTLVVVGFLGEVRLLELQARSIAKFASDAFSEILYVVNERKTEQFLKVVQDRIVPELGATQAIVHVLPGEDVAGVPLDRTDWRSQQSLKLLAAKRAKSPSILILDSKNHFVRSVTARDFVTESGELVSFRYPVNQKFALAFQNACTYFGVKPPPSDFLALPTVAPFMISTEACLSLIDHVEARERKSFHSFFSGNKDFTEFYFYLAFLLSQPGLIDRMYVDGKRRHATLFRSMANDPGKALQQLSLLDDDATSVLGVHRQVLEEKNTLIVEAVASSWIKIGLVNDRAEADYFLTPDTVKSHRWYWPF